MTDYWLSKLLFDLQKPAATAEWRQDREAVLARYPLRPEVRAAVLADDLAVIAPRVNAFLLRFYLSLCGMSDPELIARLRALAPVEEEVDG